MSKGISKRQRTILGLLDGSIRGQVYRNCSGGLDTNELLEELIALGSMPEDGDRKLMLFTVRRACISLLNRGLLDGHYGTHCTYPWAKVLSWSFRKG